MFSVLLVGKEPTLLVGLADELTNRNGYNVVQVGSGKEALSLLAKEQVDVVVAAELLSDGPALNFVKDLMKKYPQINCAMANSLPPEEFHEITEGLGVFMQLPVQAGAEEANKIMQFLNSINALMGE